MVRTRASKAGLKNNMYRYREGIHGSYVYEERACGGYSRCSEYIEFY